MGEVGLGGSACGTGGCLIECLPLSDDDVTSSEGRRLRFALARAGELVADSAVTICGVVGGEVVPDSGVPTLGFAALTDSADAVINVAAEGSLDPGKETLTERGFLSTVLSVRSFADGVTGRKSPPVEFVA